MQRPNILILYTDQHRWDALGANGNPHIHTPHLDQLTAEGVNFDHFFVQNPLCMPSRASFLTGRYPSTLGITHMGVPMPEGIPNIAHYFGDYGYQTANFGKLHFLPHANRDHRKRHPHYGFDQLEISDEPGVYEDAYRAWVRHIAPDQLPHLSVGLPPATKNWYETMGITDHVPHPSAEAREDFAGAIPFPGCDEVTHTAFVADRTIDFLSRQQGERPFLCIAGFYSPHAPWVVPQRFLDLYDPATLPIPNGSPEIDAERAQTHLTDAFLQEAKQGYYAMISEVDHHIGRVLEQLETGGLSENTIVVFTADHGEWLGDHLRFGKGYPGDDAVTRVPCILRWPEGGWQTGQRSSAIVEAVDVLPTLLAAAGIQIVPELQGRSCLPILQGKQERHRDSALVEFAGWKGVRTAHHRYVLHADGSERLWQVNRSRALSHELEVTDHDLETVAKHRLLLLTRMLKQEQPLGRVWPY